MKSSVVKPPVRGQCRQHVAPSDSGSNSSSLTGCRTDRCGRRDAKQSRQKFHRTSDVGAVGSGSPRKRYMFMDVKKEDFMEVKVKEELVG